MARGPSRGVESSVLQSFCLHLSPLHRQPKTDRTVGWVGMEGGDLLPLCVLISPLASNPAHILISVKGLFFFFFLFRQTFLMLNEDRNPGPIGPLAVLCSSSSLQGLMTACCSCIWGIRSDVLTRFSATLSHQFVATESLNLIATGTEETLQCPRPCEHVSVLEKVEVSAT